jgi:hypothetical protein
MQFKRHRSQEKDLLTASPSKLERQSTTINFQTRAPTLYSLTTDHDHHGICELRRRQVCFSEDFSRIHFFILIDLCIKSFNA